MQVFRFAAMAAATFVAACAGSGEGLDENGRPAEGESAPLTAELSSIQEKVFTPICTTCHAGSAAPLGFRLDADVAYSMLVNAPSVEEPTLLRVAPGNPDASYLIQKLEGTARVGARMPLNGPPLPVETIAVIRQWIVDGAAASNSPPAFIPTKVRPTKVRSAWPIQDAIVTESRAPIVLESTQELDTSLLHASTVTLTHASAHQEIETTAAEMTPRIVLRSLDPTVLAIEPGAGRWAPGRYELRLSGSAPLAIAARDSRPIDGDDDGQPGGDFVLRFEVEAE
jgi:hypothetical protein